MGDLSERIRCKKLLSKVASAEDAIRFIKSGMSVGICSDLLSILQALEKRPNEGSDFQIQLWSGVAILEADRLLGKLGRVNRRIGQQTLLRKAINARQVEYLDTPLGFFYQSIRAREFGPLDLAIIEAVGITEEGNLIPSYRVSDMPNFAQAATPFFISICPTAPKIMQMATKLNANTARSPFTDNFISAPRRCTGRFSSSPW